MIESQHLRSGPYATNGVTTAFPVTFEFDASDELKVYRVVTATGARTLLALTTDYTVSGGNGDTGTVTISPALATGSQIVILRNQPYQQELDLANQGPYNAAVVEAQLDRLVMQIQQLAEQVSRCYKKVITDTSEPDADELLESLTELVITPVSKTLVGYAQANLVFGKYTAPSDADMKIERVEIEAYGGAPVGQDIIAKFKIDGVLDSTAITLGSASYYENIELGTAITVPAGSTVEWVLTQVGMPQNPGNNVTVTPYFRRVNA